VATLTQGRIVWATVPDPQGRNPKDRPLVVISDSSKSAADDDLVVVAVTTQAHEAPREHCVALPWARGPGCITKLTEPSATVCTWLCTINKSAIRKVGGLVPPKFVKEILAKIDEMPKGPP
jgi:mRNA-degrading endonuclease toxin of MazEF toxin-antitoxin module